MENSLKEYLAPEIAVYFFAQDEIMSDSVIIDENKDKGWTGWY